MLGRRVLRRGQTSTSRMRTLSCQSQSRWPPAAAPKVCVCVCQLQLAKPFRALKVGVWLEVSEEAAAHQQQLQVDAFVKVFHETLMKAAADVLQHRTSVCSWPVCKLSVQERHDCWPNDLVPLAGKLPWYSFTPGRCWCLVQAPHRNMLSLSALYDMANSNSELGARLCVQQLTPHSQQTLLRAVHAIINPLSSSM